MQCCYARESLLKNFNKQLESLPHKYKFFVAGNHEIAFSHHSAQSIQRRLPSCIYLQDESVVIDSLGLSIYGTPWTRSSHRGFSATCSR